ncbi:MAG: class I SAM-dependent methyltransferase [Patescibacteria group bacterium]
MRGHNLNETQRLQEASYDFPYHWAIDPDTTKGRLYFGYLHLAISLSKQLKHKDPSTLRILDAGCGDARFLKELQERGDYELHGSDYSEQAIAFARLLLPHVSFSTNDLTQETQYPADHFDVIFLIETLEHIIPEEIPNLMRELKRILKPGGELIITVPSINRPLAKKHFQHFSAESLTAAQSGYFSDVTVVGQDRLEFHPLKLLYALLDNKWWLIKPLARWYNRKVWPKHFNQCAPSHGRRVISRSVKG